MSIKVVRPVPIHQARPATSPLASRPSTLDGKTVGLLFNSKVNADIYLERMQELLDAKYTGIKFVNRTKPTATRPTAPALLREVSTCDVVVNAFGDCGSCSSWSVHDGVALERAGVPSISVISEPFGIKVRLEVESWGVPELPVQILPHPIGQLPRERMRAIADDAFDEVVFALTNEASVVADAYRDAVSPRSTYDV
ncbi:UGSC family (seleno)protein [Actinophytocola sp.]|uniref:UGSC family (seleno)protein n=1 Tax=Actinophytocola sp. TaxID=1872138 RepID=UPI003D6C0B72